MRNKKYVIILLILLFLFSWRVLGQFLVMFFAVDFLPEPRDWYSGLLSYPYLLIAQILILITFTKICLDLGRNQGYFAHKRINGNFLMAFGLVYFISMVFRFIIFGISIPVFFHWILASFIITLGLFYKERKPAKK